MASCRSEHEKVMDNEGIPLDIDNVHMLLQVEQEQIQKRTFTNWINAQLSKRFPPCLVLDLFSDLKDGTKLLDLLEVMSGHSMKRERGHGVFQHRGNIETALNFLKKKSVKLVNINISDIIDGRPSIILGLIWTIILHCHIEELASALSFSSRHSSMDSLSSLDSCSSSSALCSPILVERLPTLHTRFRVSAKKALLMWVREQCQRSGCSISVKDFKSSWCSGEAFLAILSSLRPDLVDLPMARSRSNRENLEEAFRLAEQELHIPRLLEPQDVDVRDPDDKSIMTYVAQFLQYSNDCPTPDEDFQLYSLAQPCSLSPVNLPSHFTPAITLSPLRQASPNQKAREVTCWLDQAYQELSEGWAATEKASYAEQYQTFKTFAGSFSEQRRPAVPLLAALSRISDPSKEQLALRTAWNRLEDKLQQCKAELDRCLPHPLDSIMLWLKHMEEVLTEAGWDSQDHSRVAKEARAQQEKLKTASEEMKHHLHTLHMFNNTDQAGAGIVPLEQVDEIKRRFTNARVTAKFHGIKLEYHEQRHIVLDLLGQIGDKLCTWKGPFSSKEAVHLLLQDWHETTERQGLVFTLTEALVKLRQTANTFCSKAALEGHSLLVTQQVKEAERETKLTEEAVEAVKGTMERTVTTWEAYDRCLSSLLTWLAQEAHSQTSATKGVSHGMGEWTSCQGRLNEAGNFLIDVTEPATSRALAMELRKVNKQWAEHMKTAMFEVSTQPSEGLSSPQAVRSLTQEASWTLREPLDLSVVPLKAYRKRLQLLSKKIVEVDSASVSAQPDLSEDDAEKNRQTLKTVWQGLARAEVTCGELQRAASFLEGRLAELEHWSTEALEAHQRLMERESQGHLPLDPEARLLISRGLQLEGQLVMEGQDLQALVVRAQTSSLPSLSALSMQNRVSTCVSHCQHVVGMLSSLGSRQTAGATVEDEPFQKVVVRLHTQPELQEGSFSALGNVNVIQGNLLPQKQSATQSLTQAANEKPNRIQISPKGFDLDQEKILKRSLFTAILPAESQTQPRSQVDSAKKPHVRFSLAQGKAEPQPTISSKSQPPVLNQPLIGCPAPPLASSQSTRQSRVRFNMVKERREGLQATKSQSPALPQSTPIQSGTARPRVRKPSNCQQEASQAPLTPPVLVNSEVHSKAQAMARSRLERATLRLEERIQEASILFSDKDMSEWQAKRQQMALRNLRPTILEEFLGAVEGFGAFCSGTELGDLELLSHTVRNQWEACFPAERRLGISELVEGLGQLSETLASQNTPQLVTVQLKDSNRVFERQLLSRPQSKADHTAHDREQELQLPAEERSPSGETSPLDAEEHPVRVQDHVLHTHRHLKLTYQQAIVGERSVESKQAPERAVVLASSPPPVLDSPQQKVLQSYRASRSAFQAQLESNRQQLEVVSLPEPVTITALHTHIKNLQALKNETEEAWFEFELQSSQYSQIVEMGEGEGGKGLEQQRIQLLHEWRGQQICLQTRMASLDTAVGLMESADHQMALFSDQLDCIVREPINIISFGLADPQTVAVLKGMDQRLQAEQRNISGWGTAEEGEAPSLTTTHPLCLRPSGQRLHQLQQQLKTVQVAMEALEHLLSRLRMVNEGTTSFLPPPGSCGPGGDVAGPREGRAEQASVEHSFREEAQSVDDLLRATGMTLTTAGTTVTSLDLVASLAQQLKEVEKKPAEGVMDQKEEAFSVKGNIQRRSGDAHVHTAWNQAQWEELRGQSGLDLHAPVRWTNDEGEDSHGQWKEPVTLRKKCEYEAMGSTFHRKGQVKKEDEKKALAQRKAALHGILIGIQGEVEQQGPIEPTLAATQQRMRALTDLESRLVRLQAEIHCHSPTSKQTVAPSGTQEEFGELEILWEEIHCSVTERLEQCSGLAELLRRYQATSSALSCSIQRAERSISGQASYMGKDNLQRLYTTVQDTKAELTALSDGVEEFRGVCRQLQTQLRQIPGCDDVPYKKEADSLMDLWLDVTERSDAHLDSLCVGLALWEGLQQLAGEVDSWASNKLIAFAQSQACHGEEEAAAIHAEVFAQEENLERFHLRASEIQELLQSQEPPLEMQVAETQMRKKIGQVKELISKPGNVFIQSVAAERLAEEVVERSPAALKLQEGGGVLCVSGAPKQLQGLAAEDVLDELHPVATMQGLAAEGHLLQETQAEEPAHRDLEVLRSLRSTSLNTRPEVDGAAAEGTLDVGLLLIATFSGAMPNQLPLSNCVGAKRRKKRQQRALNVLHKSTAHFASLSNSMIRQDTSLSRVELLPSTESDITKSMDDVHASHKDIKQSDEMDPSKSKAQTQEAQTSEKSKTKKHKKTLKKSQRQSMERREVERQNHAYVCQNTLLRDNIVTCDTPKRSPLPLAQLYSSEPQDNIRPLTQSTGNGLDTHTEVSVCHTDLMSVKVNRTSRKVATIELDTNLYQLLQATPPGSSGQSRPETRAGISTLEFDHSSSLGGSESYSCVEPETESTVVRDQRAGVDKSQGVSKAEHPDGSPLLAEHREHHSDSQESPNKVFTIVLDVDLTPARPQEVTNRKSLGGRDPGAFTSQGSHPSHTQTLHVSSPEGSMKDASKPISSSSREQQRGLMTGGRSNGSESRTWELKDSSLKEFQSNVTPVIISSELKGTNSTMQYSLSNVQRLQPDSKTSSDGPSFLTISSGARNITGLQEGHDSEGREGPFPSEIWAMEVTSGTPSCSQQKLTMRDILSEVRYWVEKSDITNGSCRTDSTSYLQQCDGDAKTQLDQTVVNVLRCRYQPAQLDLPSMARLLRDAESHRLSVQELVSVMSAVSTMEPMEVQQMERRCSSALLNASATVQVKAAQLELVTQYHKQTQAIRALIQTVADEMGKLSLTNVGSSALQAGSLHALLKKLEARRGMVDGLHRLSGRVLAHLSEAEGSGALLAQLVDILEELRLLEGALSRAARHASISSSQVSILMQESKQLHIQLEAFHATLLLPPQDQRQTSLELILKNADLENFNQLHLHLQCQLDALVQFGLGRKERQEIECVLQNIRSLLDVTKSLKYWDGNLQPDHASDEPNKQIKGFILWAKQMEHQISLQKNVSLFPEEVHIQMSAIRKIQSDIISRRSKMQFEVKISEESYQVISSVKTLENLYKTIADNCAQTLKNMEPILKEREEFILQLNKMETWLAEASTNKEPQIFVENLSERNIDELESKLQCQRSSIEEAEKQLVLVGVLLEKSEGIVPELSLVEKRYLIKKLIHFQTELDGIVAHQRASSWELEEHLHALTASSEELAAIQKSLKQILVDVEQLGRFPLTMDTVSPTDTLKHMLTEHQCQIQALQHCDEALRVSLLWSTGELQDTLKRLEISSIENEKYLCLRKHIEKSRDIANGKILRFKDKTVHVEERFRLCQILLVELPLIKTQCQEAADQLEAISEDLDPSQLILERQRIQQVVEILVSWELCVTEDIQGLEGNLLEGLCFQLELPATRDLLQSTKQELVAGSVVDPDERAIYVALQRCWVTWRNLESGMRVLEALGNREKVDINKYRDIYSLRDGAVKECHSQMEGLSRARESLKDYKWASQGALTFLWDAKLSFLSPLGGALDCLKEQHHIHDVLASFNEGLQAHIDHLGELVPQHTCLSPTKSEHLHIKVLSHLMVGRATLEAQAQLRLEALQRCANRQQRQRNHHEAIGQLLSGCEATLSECTGENADTHDKCLNQQERATALMSELRSVASQIKDVGVERPAQGCCVDALWRRWAALRCDVGLIQARAEHRGEEWRDITISMEQCSDALETLKAKQPDPSVLSSTPRHLPNVFNQAETPQTVLEQQQREVASLELRLAPLLGLSNPEVTSSPAALSQRLRQIKESYKSLSESSVLHHTAAQTEEEEEEEEDIRRFQVEIRDVELQVASLLGVLETQPNTSQKQQDVVKALAVQRTQVESIVEGVSTRYTVVPHDMDRRLQDISQCLLEAQDKYVALPSLENSALHRLTSGVAEVHSGLEKVQLLLQERSPTVTEAQHILKRVWDELDTCRSDLSVLECEVQDLGEEQPEQAHLLMDQLTKPLQLYQDVAQRAEQRTNFLSKEYEDMLYSATCWLDEARSWLNAPCSYTTARSLQSHASTLQMVLDDSTRIRVSLDGFRAVLLEVSAVCDTAALENRLAETDQQVQTMQQNLLGPLEQLMNVTAEVEAIEAELKTMEKNTAKIQTILSSMDASTDISLDEHLHNRQVILANIQSMRRTLEEVEGCRSELGLPQGQEKTLTAFSRARGLLQPLLELEQLTKQQSAVLEEGLLRRSRQPVSVSSPKQMVPAEVMDQMTLSEQKPFEGHCLELDNEEETELDEDNLLSSSSDTLIGSDLEDPDETLEEQQLVQRLALSDNCPTQLLSMPQEPGYGVKEQQGEIRHPEVPSCSAAQETQQKPEISSVTSRSLEEKEEQEDEEKPWNHLNQSLCGRLSTLRKVEEDIQTLPGSRDVMLEERGQSKKVAVVFGILQELQECRSILGTLKCKAINISIKVPQHDVVERQLHSALHRLFLSLDPLTVWLLSGQEDTQLRLLQQECVLTELARLQDSLSSLGSEVSPTLLSHNPEALQCVVSLQGCLQAAHASLTSLQNQLQARLGLRSQSQALLGQIPYQVCVCEEFVLCQSDPFTNMMAIPVLQSTVGVQSTGSREKTWDLQQVSLALLQGLAGLVELGEERLANSQPKVLQSRAHLQSVLTGHKNFFNEVGSRLAFVQWVFQHHPQEALESQKEEQAQLGHRVQALRQRALEQEVNLKQRLQAWSQWEEGCGQLHRLLETWEALVPGDGPTDAQGEDTMEGSYKKFLQDRIDTCQRLVVELEGTRGRLGLVLDQGEVLQRAHDGALLVSLTEKSLELRWRNLLNEIEREARHSQDVLDNWTRPSEGGEAQCDTASSMSRVHRESLSLTEWIRGSNQRLGAWADLKDDTDQELTRSYLIQLLELSVELEAKEGQRASIARAGTLLLQSPGLGRQLAQLEQSWTQVTSALPMAQERLHELLLVRWPPLELLLDLETWLKQREACLERESACQACDAAHLLETQQHAENLKEGLGSGQLLLDFLCEPGPRPASTSPPSDITLFAELLGELSVHWLGLQGARESQRSLAEEKHHVCVKAERRLQRLCDWVTQHTDRLEGCSTSDSHTLAQRALLELEVVEERLGEVCVELHELGGEHVGKAPISCAFTQRTQAVHQACSDLRQLIVSRRLALQQSLNQWELYEKVLADVSFNTTRLRCSLEQQQGPLFTLQQVKGSVEGLQQLQVESANGSKLLESLAQRYEALKQTVCPVTGSYLSDRMEQERTRWAAAVKEVGEELQRSREVLALWQKYTGLSECCSLGLLHLQQQWKNLSRSPFSPQLKTLETIHSIKTLQERIVSLQSSMEELMVSSTLLIGRLQPLPSDLIQSETRRLSQDLLLLGQALSGRRLRLEDDLEQQKIYYTSRDSIKEQTENILHSMTTNRKDKDFVQTVVRELSSLLPVWIDLTENSGWVTPEDPQVDLLQSVARTWLQALVLSSEMNREVEAELQCSQSFQQKCDTLAALQDDMMEDLALNMEGSYSGLRDKLPVLQMLQLKALSGQQFLHRIAYDALTSLEEEQAEKGKMEPSKSQHFRSEFRSGLIHTVCELRERWQSTVCLLGERQAQVRALLGQWKRYRRGQRILWGLLGDMDSLLPPKGPVLCSLQQLHISATDSEHLEETLRQHSSLYTQTLEAGQRLCASMTNPRCQDQMRREPSCQDQMGGAAVIQRELQALQEAWQRCTGRLRDSRSNLKTIHQKWDRCQAGVDDSKNKLNHLKMELSQALPKELQELASEEKIIKEKETSLQLWAESLTQWSNMKTDLSQYVVTSSASLLQEQVEELHCEWDELCLKVSCRRQDITDCISAWAVFDAKHKELSEWLAQMESKVSHSGDLSIEEMVQKLKKDCMEEINLFSENKSLLRQLGEQLMLASEQAKRSQLHGTLQEVNERWGNLSCHIEARVSKLKETLCTVQRLDRTMMNLRCWLRRVERLLAPPVAYGVCHQGEIHRRLAEQQELQQDIQQHGEGVAAVLSLCDVLLGDQDAWRGHQEEKNSILQTSRSLDQRWRNICSMALERRLRIEETWKLWSKFLDDYSRLDIWLKVAEHTAANPNSAEVTYTVAKEELNKFEGFQRQVQEQLAQLELVNNQYCRLARENRSDQANQLKAMVHQGNQRWDALHQRVGAIVRRLKHFTGQREAFESTRESLVLWLTELDLQLTNVEHFSERDVLHRTQQLNSFQREITLNTERIDRLIVFGEGLIQGSCPPDAALMGEELEELHSYCQEVFGRVVRFHQRLTQPPTLEEVPELHGRGAFIEQSVDLGGLARRNVAALPATPTYLLAPPLELYGRETSVSADLVPLEWDHTGDVGSSSSHEDEEEHHEKKEVGHFSSVSVPVRAMAAEESPAWPVSEDPERDNLCLDRANKLSASHTSTPFKQGFDRLMSECSGSLEDVKRVSLILDDQEQEEEHGITALNTVEKQSGVIERWELFQAQAMSDQIGGCDLRQMTSDLADITSWLGSVTPDLERVLGSDSPSSFQDMETQVKHLKEVQRKFDCYKAVMLSLHLGTRHLQGSDSLDVQELRQGLGSVNQSWAQASSGLEEWERSLRHKIMRCQEFHETLHSLLLWLAYAESRRFAVDIHHADTTPRVLKEHHNSLTCLQGELRSKQAQVVVLQSLWSELQPDEVAGESAEAQEKLHVTGNKLRLLLREVTQDLSVLQQRLDSDAAKGDHCSADHQKLPDQEGASQKEGTAIDRVDRRDASPRRSLFSRMLRAAFSLHLLLALLLILTCLVPVPDSDCSCTLSNNFARSFYPMLRYNNGPPPT